MKREEPTLEVVEEKPKVEYKRLPLTPDGKLLSNDYAIESPRNLVIVKYPKSGSTLSLCDVPKVLILDTERGTSTFKPKNRTLLIDETVADQYVSTKKYGYIPKAIFDVVDELNIANNMSEFWKLHTEMENERDVKVQEGKYKELLQLMNSMPFPIVAVDTITTLVDLSNAAALYEYNLGVKDSSKKADIKRVDEYGGVQYIRRKFAEIKNFIEQNAAPFIQYHGHVATRKKVLKKGEEDVTALDIALEGILSVIFTAKANAVCTFYRDEKGCYLDFSKKEETDLGGRNLHLTNRKIKIADIVPDEELRKGAKPKTYWSEIYPEIKF